MGSVWSIALLTGLVQLLFLVLLSPLIQGVIKKVKAVLQGRQGPSIWQPYYDMRKYFRKSEVVSEHASWLFLATPYVVFACTVTAAAMVPIVSLQPLLSGTGDLVYLVYLLALARFFIALAGVDTGSSFGAMGSSRDMFVAVLSEPALFVTTLAIALPFKTTNLSVIADGMNANPSHALTPSYFLILLSFVILLIVETGRIPVDNPDTHLELTMIHEGALLEYSGRRLGLLTWSAWIKQALLFAMLINFCVPWGISTAAGLTAPGPLLLGLVVFLLKAMLMAFIAASIEMSYAKMRFFRLPRLLSAVFVLSVIAIGAEHLF